MPSAPMPERPSMNVSHLLVDLSTAWSGWSDLQHPLGFVDLDTCPAEIQIESLPPFPLIGLGSAHHPLAGSLDAIMEPPFSAEMLVRNVEQAPKAAAITMQLLRSTEGLPLDRALTIESFCYGLLQGGDEYEAWLSRRMPAAEPLPAGRVLIEREGDTLVVTIDRPAALNAIDTAIRDQLYQAFALASLDLEIRTVRLRSIGAAFSVGGDLEEFGTTRDPASAHLIRSRTLPALLLARCADRLEAHIQGACVGSGLEMAAFARRLTASRLAWFQLPELAMGLLPGAGGCISVPRRIGRQRAALMMLSGKRINAATALDWGLIDAIEDLPAADEGGADMG